MQAVVFDFDGLILDTETAIFEAMADLYAEHGCTLERAEWAATVGVHDPWDPYAALAERAGGPVPDRATLERAHRDRVTELLAAEAALPGVVEWLEAAAELGLGVGVASNSGARWVEGHLDRLGLRHHFAVVSTRDDDVEPKPAPDVYLLACERLAVPPAEAIAVEDSPIGVAAAKAAGLYCVAVPAGLTRDLDFAGAGADVVVESLAALPLADLVRR